MIPILNKFLEDGKIVLFYNYFAISAVNEQFCCNFDSIFTFLLVFQFHLDDCW